MDIMAGIVLYNPEKKRLKENIDAIINQVDKIVLVDNGSDLTLDTKDFFGEASDKVVLIRNSENKGIAKALNQILEILIVH
mgnify:CR=1 FL=1